MNLGSCFGACAFALAAGFGLTATSALADCPPRVTDTKMITLAREKPFLSSLFRATPKGLFEARVVQKDGGEERVSTIYHHALAPADVFKRGGKVTLRYDADIGGLDRLDEAGVWKSAVALEINGAAVASGTATKRLIGTGEVSIGECRFAVWQVEDRLDLDDGDNSVFVQSYAPSLGLVVRSVAQDANGNVQSEVTYDSVSWTD